MDTATPTNPVSGYDFSRGNVDRLIVAADDNGYTSSEWATYRQWQEAGRQVRKGEKGTRVLLPRIERVDGEDVATGRIAKGYTVFNIEQTDEATEVAA